MHPAEKQVPLWPHLGRGVCVDQGGNDFSRETTLYRKMPRLGVEPWTGNGGRRVIAVIQKVTMT